jgi:hypothetical protein
MRSMAIGVFMPSSRGGQAGPELGRSVMRELDLVACQPRPWQHSLTESGPSGRFLILSSGISPPDAPGTKMVGDITYIPTWQG